MAMCFKCGVCGDDSFHNIDELLMHKQSHEDNTQFIGTGSGKRGRVRVVSIPGKAENVKRRKKEESEAATDLKCDSCDFVAENVHGLRVHLSSHANQCDKMCPVCNRAFTRRGWLEKHIAREHPSWKEAPTPMGETVEEGVKCGICGQVLLHADALYTHAREFHPDWKPTREVENGETIEEKPKETTEMAQKEGMHTCKYCGDQYDSGAKLGIHVIHEHAEKTKRGKKKDHTCKQCGERFKTPSALGGHVTQHHRNNEAEPVLADTTAAPPKRGVVPSVEWADVLKRMGYGMVSEPVNADPAPMVKVTPPPRCRLKVTVDYEDDGSVVIRVAAEAKQ